MEDMIDFSTMVADSKSSRDVVEFEFEDRTISVRVC